MKNILHIHNNHRFTWIQLTDTGDVLTAQEINHLAALGAIQPKDPWLVLIPGQQVLMTTANLPNTNHRELQKAVPYTLEEQLITDVDQLCFALGDYDEKNQLAVGVIDKKVVETYLRLLKSYQIFPTMMLPDYLAIPYVDHRWSVVITDDVALIRTGLRCGFATHHHNIRLLLQLLLDKHKENLPEKINVYHTSHVNRKNKEVANHQVPIENIASKNPFIYLSTWQSPPLNLLQNQYRPKFKLTNQRRRWLYVGMTAMAWLVILIGSKIIIGYDLRWHLHRLQAQVLQHYQHVFPGATIIDDPRSKIEHELNALTHNSQGSQFIRLLSRVSTVFHRFPTIHLQSIAFHDNQLTLQISTDNLTTLTQFTRTLNEQSVNVKQNQMHNNDKKITAELLIQ